MKKKSTQKKVVEGGIGMAIAVVVVFIIESVAKIEIPSEVVASAAFIIGYFIPSTDKEKEVANA